jgi:hypothetical protein
MIGTTRSGVGYQLRHTCIYSSPYAGAANNDVLSQNNSTSLETHADCIYHKGPLNLK